MAQRKLTEKDFLSEVIGLLEMFHWRYYHIFEQKIYARRTSKGFPDIIAIRPPRIVVVELKSNEGEMTPEQQAWFSLWEQCQQAVIRQPLEIAHGKASIKPGKADILVSPEVYLWRPDDFDEVVDLLR